MRWRRAKGSSEDLAESAYPIPGTAVQVGPDPGQRSPDSTAIPLGLIPGQRLFLDPNTGGDSQISPGPQPFDGNPVGEVLEFIDAAKMQAELLSHIDAGSARIIKAFCFDGCTIIQLTGGAGILNAAFAGPSHLRLRVRRLIMSRTTAGIGALIVGSEQYPFDLPASTPVEIDFPLVIERGSDLSFTGDGRCYILADVE
jgi:hypothetical protein